MKSFFLSLSLIVVIPFHSHAQGTQVAEIKFLYADEEVGARAVTTGDFANILYKALRSEVQTFTESGITKSMKNGENYYCIKTAKSNDTLCVLFFPEIQSIPHEDLTVTIRFDIDEGVLSGYFLTPELNQTLQWDLSSGLFYSLTN
ncbi:MAG: hypothetical protein J7501_14940 [Bdellovibrio sp.]|nr:hypothetical protein [Bdellovibrio sp.]